MFAMDFVDCPSPNYDERALPVTMIVLNYTGMPDCQGALDRQRARAQGQHPHPRRRRGCRLVAGAASGHGDDQHEGTAKGATGRKEEVGHGECGW